MKMEIFAVKDRQVDSFGNPMFLRTAGEATRSFTDEANRADAQNNIYNHPDDYDLYHLGSYDTDSGLFTTNSPEVVALGKNVKR